MISRNKRTKTLRIYEINLFLNLWKTTIIEWNRGKHGQISIMATLIYGSSHMVSPAKGYFKNTSLWNYIIFPRAVKGCSLRDHLRNEDITNYLKLQSLLDRIKGYRMIWCPVLNVVDSEFLNNGQETLQTMVRGAVKY